MNARQQEPPSSHLHGAGHNTSISRQRRTTKNKVGYSLPFSFLEISGGQIESRPESRSRCRCQTLTRRSIGNSTYIAGQTRGVRGRGQAVERTEAVRASTEGQESRDSRGDGGGSRRHERTARTHRRSRVDRHDREQAGQRETRDTMRHSSVL